ncbi:hypothetical protein [Sphingomonas sp. Y38-1Y]|uniref:hypothetical protein n=1 Tax=Sphingomonas sp. Y38-1Y TaxID=3078265 RepID=UPI0028F01194|nr:hypothetical protein [Sphingomonas sp. Y38-1Y]
MRWLLPILAACVAMPVQAAEDCYDRIVTGTIAAQVPAPVPELEDGSIVMSWPWFVDLTVDRPGGGAERLSVQTVQHTYFARALRGRWLLRRNRMGGYNARWRAHAPRARRCSRDAPPARPYLGAESPAALEKLRRESEARDGVRR